MVLISELLEPQPETLWTIVRQAGVKHVIVLLEGAEQQTRSRLGTTGKALEEQPVPRRGERPWDTKAIAALQRRVAEHGFTLAGIEDTAPMDKVRLGLPGRDEQIGWVIDQIQAMGELGIGVLCYNWMAVSSWARTRSDVALRGGALATGFDNEVNETAAPLAEAGSITEEQLWDALEYFLQAVLPVAESAGVRLGLHPDDPPVPAIRGVPRIMRSIDAYRRLVGLVPSNSNGITLCQGNFTLMTDDLPAVIREFGHADKIAFVHFRDVRGTADSFIETFHDEGQTDMAECMRAYHEVGFTGPMRPDHVPTLAGEANDLPGYGTLGRLFAVGYIAGLREAVYGIKTTFEAGP